MDEEIQKMAELCCIMRDYYGGCSRNCRHNQLAECGTPALYDMAKRLLNMGYCKADEVRKETAKAVLQYLYGQTFEPKDPNFGDLDDLKEVISREDILNTAKMYGVEVKE